MYRLTTTKLTLIQEINDAVHEHYNAKFIQYSGGKISKTSSKARAVSVGLAYHNMDTKLVEISACLGLANHQTRLALDNFNAMLEREGLAREFGKLWKSILTKNNTINFSLDIVNGVGEASNG